MNLHHLFSVIEAGTLSQTDALDLVINQVSSANSQRNEAANDHYPKRVVTPVMQETVRQSFVAHIEPLKAISTSDLTNQLANQVKHGVGILPQIEEVHLIPKTEEQPNSFTPTVETYPPMEDGQPYTTDELLTRYERPLFNHLLACPYCHIKKAQYCAKGYGMGSVYDALLLNRDDTQLRRESLALRVDKALISSRSTV